MFISLTILPAIYAVLKRLTQDDPSTKFVVVLVYILEILHNSILGPKFLSLLLYNGFWCSSTFYSQILLLHNVFPLELEIILPQLPRWIHPILHKMFKKSGNLISTSLQNAFLDRSNAF